MILFGPGRTKEDWVRYAKEGNERLLLCHENGESWVARFNSMTDEFYSKMALLYRDDPNYGWKEQIIFNLMGSGLYDQHPPENWVPLTQFIYVGLTAHNN